MKEKILSAIKTAVSVNGKTSISDKTLNSYVDLIAAQISEESQIATAIVPHVAVLKELQLNINSVAAEAAKGKETELQKQIEELKKLIPSQAPPKNDDVPDWQKAIEQQTELIKNLTNSLSNLQAEQTNKTLSAKLTETLKAKNVPEWFSANATAGRTFKDEAEITAFAETLGTSWETAKQQLANNGFKETVPPATGATGATESDALAAQIAAGTKQIVEQNKN
jgi:hypothetical protein